jgi:hypothetical protein
VKSVSPDRKSPGAGCLASQSCRFYDEAAKHGQRDAEASRATSFFNGPDPAEREIAPELK